MSKENLSSLRSFIDRKKTLIITCHECYGLQEAENDYVYTYYCLGNMLRKNDYLQQENINYYIETKGCTQIIVAGHYNCGVIDKILENELDGSPLFALRYKLDALLHNQSHHDIKPDIKNRLIIELNVIEQLKLLMQYEFIHQRTNRKLLELTGIIINHGKAHKIFYNGITFNGLLSSN